VWLAEVDKTRPVIVLTRNPMGRYLNAVLVAPVTSTVRGVSTEVPVGPADGIRVESVANLDNTQLLARTRLVRRVGHATPDTMFRLCSALAIAVDCTPN
jgi:mRNA interferase MazF